ncbi:NAD(+)/NADH kinase [Candidatus Micrarchaeota archaeon]|nr:NAD(+)/NADH kinase [Candidatus Micrarchaeota archaeon]
MKKTGYSKAAVVGRDCRGIRPALEAHGFEIVGKKPDFVVSFGGDGTLLYAERAFPGAPKLRVRANRSCISCGAKGKKAQWQYFPTIAHYDRARQFRCLNCLPPVLEKIRDGRASIVEEPKIHAILFTQTGRKRKEFTALNEVQVHNEHVSAIRFAVSVGSRLVAEHASGDGAIVATPFGSTGYFNAVTRRVFSKGFAIAFNNPTRPRHAIYLPNLRPPVKITVLERDGVLVADNDAENPSLRHGDYVIVSEAKEKARLIRTA